MAIKILIDFGLVILIWMTQLVVYPSFTYFESKDLVRWHGKYTTAVSFVVMPLMIAQLGLHSYDLSVSFSWFRTLTYLLVLLTWVNTFFYAVPLHNRISVGSDVSNSAKKLVVINRYRTALWSLVFLIGLFEYLKNA
ncbi:hypothetical protein [Ekhidna sp. To15]|uniref:hypothetical protein n=1 Tax=Ekhidna sp. To15 TaxID=3395267 RepID=UPI003F523CDA